MLSYEISEVSGIKKNSEVPKFCCYVRSRIDKSYVSFQL